jgi:hypothetical protein
MNKLPVAVHSTSGGLKGHVFRRLIHISMGFIPFVYYFYIPRIVDYLTFPAYFIVLMPVLIILILELIRMSLGWAVFGQRQYEKQQIASFAWGAFSIGAILLLLPKEYGIPIVASWALGDPLLGELRRFCSSRLQVAIIGIVFIEFVWFLAVLLLDTPFWIALMMGPIMVAAEWPKLKWIDDNATMLLIPLVVVLVLTSI